MRTLELTDDQYEHLARLADRVHLSIGDLFIALADAHDQGQETGVFQRSGNATTVVIELHSPRPFEPIRKSSDVMGGAACIRQTRVPIWLLVSFKMQGMSDGELLRAYPFLDASDLSASWGYFAAHPDEIEAQIALQDDPDG